MDRLICGDVGYGKTEVAIRAAFKAVMDSKQVAVLVPTTVLAEQHCITFSERLKAFPIRVEVLSRFKSPKEQRAIIDGLTSGAVDICVGTHRLLQKDVVFKDLGLLIIDEEQRFGVAHKEYLKQMRKEVDVLTLESLLELLDFPEALFKLQPYPFALQRVTNISPRSCNRGKSSSGQTRSLFTELMA
jgi:transcription-repair coupling factor (superfamily II helicase)